MTFEIRRATIEDHKEILAIAKQHRCTKDYGSHMFSPISAYEKGWITVAQFVDEPNMETAIIGFCCVRHKVRQPETSLYFLGVAETAKRIGVAKALLDDVKTRCPNPCIALNVDLQNKPALDFWRAQGFKTSGTALQGKGISMRLEW